MLYFDPDYCHRKIRPDPDYSLGKLLLGFFVAGLAIFIICLFIKHLIKII